MTVGSLEIIINNGELSQILMLPETPFRIVFVFQEKELILRKKEAKTGLYFISHQRGFSETDIDDESTKKPILTCKNDRNINHTGSGKIVSEGCKDSSELLVKPSLVVLNTVKQDTNLLLLEPNKVGNLSEHAPVNSVQGFKNIIFSPSRTILSQNNLISIPEKPMLESSFSVSQNIQIPQHILMVLKQNEAATLSEVSTISLEKEKTKSEINSEAPCKTNETSDNESEMAGGIDLMWSDDSCDDPGNTDVHNIGHLSTSAYVTMAMKQNEVITQPKFNVFLSEKEGTKLGNNSQVLCVTNKTSSNESEMAVNIIPDGPKWETFTDECSNNLGNKYKLKKKKVNTLVHKKTSDLHANRKVNYPEFKEKTNRRCAYCLKRTSTVDPRRFFRFPKDERLCKTWVLLCNKPFLNTRTLEELYYKSFICSDHFDDTDYRTSKKHHLKGNAVPRFKKVFQDGVDVNEIEGDVNPRSNNESILLKMRRSIQEKLKNSSRNSDTGI